MIFKKKIFFRKKMACTRIFCIHLDFENVNVEDLLMNLWLINKHKCHRKYYYYCLENEAKAILCLRKKKGMKNGSILKF